MDAHKYTLQTVGLPNTVEDIIILDIDGTLVPDKSNYISTEIQIYIDTLKKLTQKKVYVCSNGNPNRTYALSQILQLPILHIQKPFGKTTGVSIPEGKMVVVGDKFLTDGLLAWRLGARFVRVNHVRSNTDSFAIKLSYILDDGMWFLYNVFKLLRPLQWVKNLLIYTPLFFAGEFLSTKLVDVTFAFIIFSFSASVVYIFNDIYDRKSDVLHPVKRYRPIAHGDISIQQSMIIIAISLSVVGLSFLYISSLIIPITLYLVANIFYSLWLKHVAVVDILLVASFYVVRVVAGGVVAQVPLSPWILLCVFFGALFIVTGKRRAEYTREIRREVLSEYSEKALDYMFTVSASVALLTYGIYTVIGHQLEYLIYSTFFVVLALFRLLNRIYTHPQQAESPEILVFKDSIVLGSFVGWVAYTFVVFYLVA